MHSPDFGKTPGPLPVTTSRMHVEHFCSTAANRGHWQLKRTQQVVGRSKQRDADVSGITSDVVFFRRRGACLDVVNVKKTPLFTLGLNAMDAL